MSSFVKVGGLIERLPVFLLIRAWKEAAGPALLKHTEFMGVFENNQGAFELRLRVPEAVWRQELEFQKDEILKRYTQVLAKLRYPSERFPTVCLLSNTPPLPINALHAQHRRNKVRVK